MATEPLLTVQDLYAGYGETEVLRGVDLSVEAGEIVAVLGSNGVGKSTLNRTHLRRRARARRLDPFRRRRAIEREKPAADRRARADPRAGGPPHLPESVGAREPRSRQLPARAAQRRAENRERVFAIFPRLYERQSQRAGTLSGGEQQMLAIGRGLMAEPKLIILDEPSLGLSPLLVEELFALIKRINADGVSVLLVEQNVVQSLEVANRAYILAEGKFVMSGNAADIGADPELKRAYLGM